MTARARKLRAAICAAALLTLGVSFSRAAEPLVEPAGALAESAAPAPIRAALAPDGVRVKLGAATVAELWVANEVPSSGDAPKKAGASYAAIAEGTLLGVIRFGEKWSDYRGHAVPAGTYTLRYLSQPNDGNHMGISEFVDYAVLAPAASDKDPQPIADRKAIYALSREASGRNHPAVLYLVPAGSAKPATAAVPAEGQVVLYAAPGGHTMGFTVRGRTEAEAN